MLLERVEDAFKTWQGIMKDEPITVVYNEPDVDDSDDGQDAGVRFSLSMTFYLIQILMLDGQFMHIKHYFRQGFIVCTWQHVYHLESIFR